MISLLITLSICITVAGVCTLFSFRGLPTITIINRVEAPSLDTETYIEAPEEEDEPQEVVDEYSTKDRMMSDLASTINSILEGDGDF